MDRLDKIALRQARFAGAALSNQERDDLGDDLDLDGDDSGKGKTDIPRALRGLLRALGVLVLDPSPVELMMLAARKIADLRAGQRGATSSANQQATNPLIAGAGESGDGMEPMYMSLAVAPSRQLTAQEIEEIAASQARKMGCQPGQGCTTFDIGVGR
jgi:hypothetical protein